jgi:hypothetical protein
VPCAAFIAGATKHAKANGKIKRERCNISNGSLTFEDKGPEDKRLSWSGASVTPDLRRGCALSEKRKNEKRKTKNEKRRKAG